MRRKTMLAAVPIPASSVLHGRQILMRNVRVLMQLATLEAAVAFLQQQSLGDGRRSTSASNSDDMDDTKHGLRLSSHLPLDTCMGHGALVQVVGCSWVETGGGGGFCCRCCSGATVRCCLWLSTTGACTLRGLHILLSCHSSTLTPPGAIRSRLTSSCLTESHANSKRLTECRLKSSHLWRHSLGAADAAAVHHVGTRDVSGLGVTPHLHRCSRRPPVRRLSSSLLLCRRC